MISWIIQDGNYPDFARNTDAAFALEFYAPHPLQEAELPPSQVPLLNYLGDASYEVLGQVVHVAGDWWVLNAGFPAFSEQKPPKNAALDCWLRGRIHIGIDPFSYFERLAHQPGAPALIYDWKIERVEVQTAPLVEVKPRVMMRDPAKFGWREIAKTDAWHDEGEYLLHCRHLDTPPRITRGANT